MWNSKHGRIEMHLVSRWRQSVEVGPYVVTFAEGETIHTENSYKHESDVFANLVRQAGWELEDTYLHPSPAFGILVLAARGGLAAKRPSAALQRSSRRERRNSCDLMAPGRSQCPVTPTKLRRRAIPGRLGAKTC